MNAKLKYNNPFKLEDLDDKANKVNSFSIHNRPIHEIINVQDDKSVSLYACFFEDFIKQTTNKDLMSLYFPNINVTNRDQLIKLRDDKLKNIEVIKRQDIYKIPT